MRRHFMTMWIQNKIQIQSIGEDSGHPDTSLAGKGRQCRFLSFSKLDGGARSFRLSTTGITEIVYLLSNFLTKNILLNHAQLPWLKDVRTAEKTSSGVCSKLKSKEILVFAFIFLATFTDILRLPRKISHRCPSEIPNDSAIFFCVSVFMMK